MVNVEENSVEIETMPLWNVALLGNECDRCGGPGLEANAELLAFVAAAEVWRVRPRRLEPWQVRAIQHLVAHAAQERARLGELDVTLESCIADAMDEFGPPDFRSGLRVLHAFNAIGIDGVEDRQACLQDLHRRLRAVAALAENTPTPAVPTEASEETPELLANYLAELSEQGGVAAAMLYCLVLGLRA